MRCLLLFTGLLLHLSPRAQNLVINGSFEDANVCTEIHQYCSPSAWFYIKNHPQGYSLYSPITPSDGSVMLKLFAVNITSGKRTYWQTMLQCSLIKGKEYRISVDMTAEQKGPNLNDLGFYFTDHFLYATTDTLMQPPRYLSMMDAKVKRLSNGWFRLQKKFIADSDYQFMVIGNFSPETNKEIGLKRKTPGNIAYFIDNLSIGTVGKNSCNDNPKLVDSLYALHDRHSHGIETTVDTIQTEMFSRTVTIDTLVLNNILFDFDKYNIKNPELFDAYTSLFSDTSITKIEITGYADNAGSEDYNLQLSKQRVISVAKLLAAKFFIAPSIMETVGKGISTKYGDRKLNRRVEIFIYRKN